MTARTLSSLTLRTASLSLGGCRTIGDDEVELGSVPLTIVGRDDGWHEWRGPFRDAFVSGIDLPDELPADSWLEAWSRTVGDGLAGIVTRDGRVYCHSRLDDQEIVTCHDADADTGTVIWSHTSALQRSSRGRRGRTARRLSRRAPAGGARTHRHPKTLWRPDFIGRVIQEELFLAYTQLIAETR